MSAFGARMDDGRGNYSTLEVAHNPATADTNKQVVDHSNLPQVVSPAPEYKQEGYYAEHNKYYEHGQSQFPQVAHDPNGNGAVTDGGKPPGKRICGLAAKTFYIVAAVVALLLIGGIVGGAVGGTIAAKKPDENPSDSDGSGQGANNGTTPGGESDTVLRTGSRVAAANWSDGKFSHYAVFSQDKYDALMVSLFDSDNQTWTSVNISKALARGGNPISVKPGTSLTAAATGSPHWIFQVNLYYLTPSGLVGEIFSKDETGQIWGVGDLVKESKAAADNSNVQALWHRCDYGCSNDIIVTYEDSQNNLILLNGSDWSESETISPGLDAGSGMALVPFITSGGANGSNAAEMRYYVNINSDITELIFDSNRTWLVNTAHLAEDISLSPLPQFAASPFDGYVQVLVIVRNPDGSIIGHRWDGENWNYDQTITLTNGPTTPKFSYIAMNMEGRFYGTIGGNIHEYRWYGNDPYNFIYIGTVELLKAAAAGS